MDAGVPFGRKLVADAQTYQCKTDEDCEKQCDAGGCKKNCLGLPSVCVRGLCACPFGPGHSASKPLTNSTCTQDHDCLTLCSSDCNIKSCLEAKCHCGCQGWPNILFFLLYHLWLISLSTEQGVSKWGIEDIIDNAYKWLIDKFRNHNNFSFLLFTWGCPRVKLVWFEQIFNSNQWNDSRLNYIEF